MIYVTLITFTVVIGAVLFQNKYEQGYWLGHWSWRKHHGNV